MLTLDAKKAFGRWFFIAVLGAFGLFVNGISYMLADAEGDALMALEFGMSLGFAQLMLPMLAALSYATSFCQEFTSGFCPEIVHRSGVSRYIRSKLLFVMFSGGLSIVIGMALFIVLLNVKFPPDFSLPGIMPDSMPSGLSALLVHPGLVPYLLYYAGVLLEQFVVGAFWALTALCFSAFYPSLALTLVMPLVFDRLAEAISHMSFVQHFMAILAQSPLFSTGFGSLLLILLPYILLAGPVALLFCWRAGRRLRYA